MKGDFALLGITGAAILAVPMLVVLGAAQGLSLPGLRVPAPQTAISASASRESASSQAQAVVGQTSAQEVFWPEKESSSQPRESGESNPKDQSQGPKDEKLSVYPLGINHFKILDQTTGKVNKVTVEEYVRGAIAAEMPASFHSEALKAQGVAALSYALYHVRSQQDSPDPELKGADFSADPTNRLGYMTEKAAREFYGDTADYNWDKICKAAEDACKLVLVYDKEPIAAAYHAISTGTTEDSINIWKASRPYLTPVDSSWDVLAQGYKSTVTISQEEIKEKLEAEGVTLLPNPDTWFEEEERSISDYITKIRVGSATMSGNELRQLLGLRSASFTITRQGKNFVFYVKGYGHGAGLSQNGADYMARQGYSFQEILLHYYDGAQLAEAKY